MVFAHFTCVLLKINMPMDSGALGILPAAAPVEAGRAPSRGAAGSQGLWLPGGCGQAPAGLGSVLCEAGGDLAAEGLDQGQ